MYVSLYILEGSLNVDISPFPVPLDTPTTLTFTVVDHATGQPVDAAVRLTSPGRKAGDPALATSYPANQPIQNIVLRSKKSLARHHPHPVLVAGDGDVNASGGGEAAGGDLDVIDPPMARVTAPTYVESVIDLTITDHS